MLVGRRIAVVGASAGIGRAVAEQAIAAGADVVVGARREDVLEEIVKQAGGGRAIRIDVCEPDSRVAFLERLRAELPAVDLLVCTAGYAELRPLAATDDDGWSRVLATNLIGLSRLVTDAVPLLSGTGVISVVSSETADAPRHSLVPYAASKAALETTLKGLRREHPGLRVSCAVVGGTFPTEFGTHFDTGQFGPAFADWQAHGLMQQEFMTPEGVAACMLAVYAAALSHPGVCVDEIVLRSPSPVVGVPPTTAGGDR